MSAPNPLSAASRAFLDSLAAGLDQLRPRAIVDRVAATVAEHENWRRRCLNLNPAESLMSLTSRRLLDSDLATRLGEGPPGDKLYPHGPQNRFADEIEGIVINLARRLFGASHVEWRPVSTSMANAIVFFALLKPGDVVLSQHEDGGGNYSYHDRGPLALTGARIVPMPQGGPTFEIDLDRLEEQIMALRPRMIVFGGSNVLFPYPVREMRELADRVEALLVYDAAHVGLLIATGDLQRPLDEGAHVVTVSTHKIMGGPVGGLVLTNEPDLAESITRLTFPGFMQTRDQNKYAALAVSLCEMLEHGPTLARQMVQNAQALGSALIQEGFKLVGADRGCTRTHQLFLELGTTAQDFERRCHAANILVSDCALAGDLALARRSGARVATHEISRRGMGSEEMMTIARLMGSAADETTDIETVRNRVEALADRFSRIRYSFDPAS